MARPRSLLEKLRPKKAVTLLVSFCNVRDYEKPVLALVTARPGKASARWITVEGVPPLGGATGLCWWGDLVCVVHQRGLKTPPGFILLDPKRGFRAVSQESLPAGPHSVCARDDGLYFVVSGRDSVYRATSTGDRWEVARYWTFPGSSGEKDENHLNSLALIDGKLCVSGFGAKEADQWTSAKNGFVYNIDDGKYLWEGIHHPHSLFVESRALWVCESAENRLISRDGASMPVPSTYLRGLAAVSDSFYVGSSRRRLISESTGAWTGGAAKGDYVGTCSLYRLVGEDRTPELVIDLSAERNEVYDILPLRT